MSEFPLLLFTVVSSGSAIYFKTSPTLHRRATLSESLPIVVSSDSVGGAHSTGKSGACDGFYFSSSAGSLGQISLVV